MEPPKFSPEILVPEHAKTFGANISQIVRN